MRIHRALGGYLSKGRGGTEGFVDMCGCGACKCMWCMGVCCVRAGVCCVCMRVCVVCAWGCVLCVCVVCGARVCCA